MPDHKVMKKKNFDLTRREMKEELFIEKPKVP